MTRPRRVRGTTCDGEVARNGAGTERSTPSPPAAGRALAPWSDNGAILGPAPARMRPSDRPVLDIHQDDRSYSGRAANVEAPADRRGRPRAAPPRRLQRHRRGRDRGRRRRAEGIVLQPLPLQGRVRGGGARPLLRRRPGRARDDGRRRRPRAGGARPHVLRAAARAGRARAPRPRLPDRQPQRRGRAGQRRHPHPARRAARPVDDGDRRRPRGRAGDRRCARRRARGHAGDAAPRCVAGRAAAGEGDAERGAPRRVPRRPLPHAGRARPMRFEQVGAEDLDRLRDLWLLLHRHHQAVAPELAPYVSDEASWAVRRSFYAELLAAGGAALVARHGDRDAGYAITGPEPAPWPATFATWPTVEELQTLVVVPGDRGAGLGSALLDAAEERRPAADRVIGVVPGNVRATAFYERRGFVPTWLTLTRFGRPPQPGPMPAAAEVADVAADEVDGLRALWLELHHHHRAVAPRLGPFVADAPSWQVVRHLFTIAAADGLLLRTGPAE